MDCFDTLQVVSLTLFLAIFFGRTYLLRQTGTEVIRLGSGKKGFSRLLERGFLVFFPLWLFEILISALHCDIQFLPDIMVRPFFTGFAVRAAGAALVVAAILLFIGALVSFKSSWRIGIDTVAPGGLITAGVFSRSRNPIFLSMDLFFLGTFFIYGNLFFGVCFIVMALGCHFQILQEENFLQQRYGERYSLYLTQVKRYI
ncbi:MAG: hypothetical protein GXY72_11520 [Deltaproteobacteria bacterium]|nr:hypothetical protein [Deltaproteobacteria bacterium]